MVLGLLKLLKSQLAADLNGKLGEFYILMTANLTVKINFVKDYVIVLVLVLLLLFYSRYSFGVNGRFLIICQVIVALIDILQELAFTRSLSKLSYSYSCCPFLIVYLV